MTLPQYWESYTTMEHKKMEIHKVAQCELLNSFSKKSLRSTLGYYSPWKQAANN